MTSVDDLIKRKGAMEVLEFSAEMLRRLLDATDLVGIERDKLSWGLGLIESCIADMESVPSADAVQVVHGYWKAVTDDGIDYKRICSCCGEDAPFDESEDVYLLYPHCPWCGASLDIKGGNGNE